MREETCMEMQAEIQRMMDNLKRLDNKYLSPKTREDIKTAIKSLKVLHKDFEF